MYRKIPAIGYFTERNNKKIISLFKRKISDAKFLYSVWETYFQKRKNTKLKLFKKKGKSSKFNSNS